MTEQFLPIIPAEGEEGSNSDYMFEPSKAEIVEQLGLIKQIALRHNPVEFREAEDADQAARIWLGRTDS